MAGYDTVLPKEGGLSPLHWCGLASATHRPLQVSVALRLQASSAHLSSNHKVSPVSAQAMFELVTSEASYYKSLNLLVSHFMENERLKKILHPSEAHILFSNVLDVMAVSER